MYLEREITELSASYHWKYTTASAPENLVVGQTDETRRCFARSVAGGRKQLTEERMTRQDARA